MDGESLQTAKYLFSLLDKRQKGFILIDELYDVGEELGKNFTESQLHFVFSALDKDGEGKITLEDFTEAFVSLSKENPGEKRHECSDARSLLSVELEGDGRDHKDIDACDVCISSVNSDDKQVEWKINTDENDQEIKNSSDLFQVSTVINKVDSANDAETTSETPRTVPKNILDDVFEGEGLLNADAQNFSTSPSRPQYSRSPSILRKKRSNGSNDHLANFTEPNEFEIRDRSPPDGNEGENSSKHRSPKNSDRSRKSYSESQKSVKTNSTISGNGFAKDAIFDLLKIVDAHTLSNLGLYSNRNGRPWRRDVTCNTTNFYGENSLGDERSCPRWLQTSQDWTESSRPGSKIINYSECQSNELDQIQTDNQLRGNQFARSSDICSQGQYFTPSQDQNYTSEGGSPDNRRLLFSPTSDYSQSSENPSDFDPTQQMDDKDPNDNFIHEDQELCIGARVDNETIGNLIFENTDENHIGLYDRILSYSGVELNHRHSTSETSLHDLILEAEAARNDASLAEDWDSVMKRINGVSLFGGNQTVRYIWQQLSVYHSDLVQPFEDFLKGIISEVQRAYMKCQELDSLLNGKAEQHERELARVYEEMDQLLIREKEQLQDKHNEKEEHLRAEFNRILELKEHDMLDALKSKADSEGKLERAAEEYQLLKGNKERLEKQLSISFGLETQLRSENDCLSQENHLLTEKLARSAQNMHEMQDQMIKISKAAESNKENYRRCFRKYQDALEEKEYFDMNINNLTQELEDLRNANKSLQDRVDSNLNTSILWRDGQSSPRTPDSPDLHGKRGSRVFGFPNGIMPLSKSQRNSLVSEPSFDESNPDVTVSHVALLPVPDVVPPIEQASPIAPKTTSTPVKGHKMLSAPKSIPVFHTGQEYKVIFVGDAAVGKSSLIRKISRGTFTSRREATANPDCHSKVVTVKNRSVTLNLWDTVGQERRTYTLKVEGFQQQLTFRFNSLPPSYFRRADVVVLVYDVIDEISFLNVKSWMKTIYEYTDENVLLVLCGNKNDLDHRRKVKEDRAANLAKLNDAIFLESSAKTGFNIPKLCETIASTLLERDDTVLIREKSVKIFEPDLLNMSRSSRKTCC